ncbi:hypothetical protein K501DRAFT_214787 [Backusella circina FSU 941]|nr:hypothetical protein K501DRAFT_214787 [Backusella circina FSU 941]
MKAANTENEATPVGALAPKAEIVENTVVTEPSNHNDNTSNNSNSSNELKTENKPAPQATIEDNTPAPVAAVNAASTEMPPYKPIPDALLFEMKHKRDKLRSLDEELNYYRRANAELVDQKRVMEERKALRQKDQKQLLDNYNEHIRSRRATNDDTNTIRMKLKDLKMMINDLSAELVQHCDQTTATKAIISFWVNLHEPISKLGTPLPSNRIMMLTEKFLMDVLVQNMNYNSFTGLKISPPYTRLHAWFDKYEPNFCTRLRQEIAKVVVQNNTPNSDIQAEINKLNKRMYASLYSSLLKAYPFIEAHDSKEQDPNKQYQGKIKSMVELASVIGYAVRGQEVEIAAAAVGEGSECLDTKTMIDEDGQTSGVIQFCVCPPFIMYGNRTEVLEKARVLCSPLPAK